MRALCCWGHGGAARGLFDRGVFLHEVVAARSSGRRGRVLCRRHVVGWLLVVRCAAVATSYEGAERLGAWPVENRNY